jgi:hypothetical protein
MQGPVTEEASALEAAREALALLDSLGHVETHFCWNPVVVS